jgi:predicted nucleic acid-binding protein
MNGPRIDCIADTSAVVGLARRDPEAIQILSKRNFAITFVTLAELSLGILKSAKPDAGLVAHSRGDPRSTDIPCLNIDSGDLRWCLLRFGAARHHDSDKTISGSLPWRLRMVCLWWRATSTFPELEA